MKNVQAVQRYRRIEDLRSDIIGIDTVVPLLDGRKRRYVFLDNAASTPAFRSVWRCVEDFLPWYSGVHRGTGYKSIVATEVYDRAHTVVAEFVGADHERDIVIFTRNTTESINKLSNRFGFGTDDVIITTSMEHHSNDLPWRKNVKVVHVGLLQDGSLDCQSLQSALKQYAGKVRLVAVSGASNITGICPPIYEIAKWVHDVGAKIFIDAAQLAPHKPIDMLSNGDPCHIDFLAFSAHKLYAPFGTGVLIGPRDFFEERDPDQVGGGVASVVTLDHVDWNSTPHRDEAGSPNVIGGVALAEAIMQLQSVGMDEVARHEQELLEYAYAQLNTMDGIRLYGPTNTMTKKVGVIPFNIEGIHPGLVGAVLATEAGIGVRNGYFCAQPYVKRMLDILQEEEKDSGCGVVSTDTTSFAGMVRASFGCYTNKDDIDHFLEAVAMVSTRQYKGEYVQDPVSGTFLAKGFTVQTRDVFPYFGEAEPQPRRSIGESA